MQGQGKLGKVMSLVSGTLEGTAFSAPQWMVDGLFSPATTTTTDCVLSPFYTGTLTHVDM